MSINNQRFLEGCFEMDFLAISMEIVKGMGLFFIHPLFYLLVFFSLFLGYRRVQRERMNFHTRVYDVVDDFIHPLIPSIFAGIALSLVIVGLGIVIPIGVIALFAVVHFLVLFTGQARWLSPAYTGSLTLLIALVLPSFETGIAIIDRWIAEIYATHLGSLAVLVGVLILIEGILIYNNGHAHSSPKLLKSKRGKTVGGHEAHRLWIIPGLFLLPNGGIPTSEFWPLIATDYSHIGFIAVPFAIGFQQVIRSTLPAHAIINYGKRVILVGLVVIILSSVSLFYAIFVPIVAVVALLLRELIAMAQRLQEEKETNMYTERENGLVILGVIPHSPAAKMNVKIGEVITKVNGVSVKTSQQFYEALQQNSAFCKLEIIDENGEIRFGQTALYDGEHYQVGLLFVQQETINDEKAM